MTETLKLAHDGFVWEIEKEDNANKSSQHKNVYGFSDESSGDEYEENEAISVHASRIEKMKKLMDSEIDEVSVHCKFSV